VRVITYGTFDLFHEGHIRLLERAKALGDYLIVAVTTENFDEARGKLNVQQSLMERVKNVQESGLADEVILEEYEGQKVNDMQKYDVDIFAIGSDWLGKFDYLNDYCKVVYLERTKGVSSTQLRNEDAGILRIGVVGTGRIAHRFVEEAVFVSGVDIEGAWSRDAGNVKAFVDKHELDLAAQSFEELLDKSDAVYIATPHGTHVDYALRAIEAGKHVLCEKPMALTEAEVVRLQTAAAEANVVLMEAIKTAYSPGFKNMVAVARTTQLIGDIRSVDATFTKLTSGDVRELDPEQDGGSLAELASYPLLAIVKLLGEDFVDMNTTSLMPSAGGVDLYSRIDFRYKHAVASARTGLGVKAEGDLVVAGTKGYLYVPAPWWKTEYFEARFENQSDNKKYYYKFDGDGLRYEIAEFSSMIRKGESETFKLRASESRWLARVLESARAEAHAIS
jgi:glycerol-3-phosphate cytidylyltransferase